MPSEPPPVVASTGSVEDTTRTPTPGGMRRINAFPLGIGRPFERGSRPSARRGRRRFPAAEPAAGHKDARE